MADPRHDLSLLFILLTPPRWSKVLFKAAFPFLPKKPKWGEEL